MTLWWRLSQLVDADDEKGEQDLIYILKAIFIYKLKNNKGFQDTTQ